MDSKEILETFGISKNFGILLFIQSIIVIIGCFLAFQEVYNNIITGKLYLIINDLVNLILFLVLIYYSFIGFRKDEKHFKIAVYLFILSIFGVIFGSIVNAMVVGSNNYVSIAIFANIIKLILACYFAYNLDNYDKAKIAILLLILVEIIIMIIATIDIGALLGIIPKLIFLIPCVSVALTYIARYNKEGFKQLNK